jgi:hypothetical protein
MLGEVLKSGVVCQWHSIVFAIMEKRKGRKRYLRSISNLEETGTSIENYTVGRQYRFFAGL